jgi:hypothetical protein
MSGDRKVELKRDQRRAVEPAHSRAIPDFRGQVMAVAHVEELLKKVTIALEQASIEHAVIGGNAVAAWVTTVDPGAVRATRDVDILVRRADLDRMRQALEPLGFMLADVLGVWMFVERANPNPRTGVHLVFAGEIIRPHYAYPAPDPAGAARCASGFRVLELPALVAMKLQAFRRIDQVHLEDLLRVGLIDDALAAQLPDDLRGRLDEIRRTMPE